VNENDPVIQPNVDIQPALLICIFSCPEAAEAQGPEAPNHVRGNLLVSMFLLRPLSSSSTVGCRLTRVASFALGGGVSKSLSYMVLTKQANLPAILAAYLEQQQQQQQSRSPPVALPWSNSSVSEQILKPILRDAGVRPPGVVNRDPQESSTAATAAANGSQARRKEVEGPRDGSRGGVKGRPKTTRTASALSYGLNITETRSSIGTSIYTLMPRYASRAVVIFAPMVAFREFGAFGVAFSMASFWSIRRVLLWNPPPLVADTITCSFTVDLKGIYRFIANAKEDREKQQLAHEDITIVHVVACAVAKALVLEKALCTRHVYIPSLFLYVNMDMSGEPIDVSVSFLTNSKELRQQPPAGGIVTLHGVDRRNVQSIADELTRTAATERHEAGFLARLLGAPRYGACWVLAPSSGCETVATRPPIKLPPGVAVMAVMGNVVDAPSVAGTGHSSSSSPRSELSISLTMPVPKQDNDVAACRRYAADVQKLLRFPEMCERELILI